MLAEEPLGPTAASHRTIHHLGNLHCVSLCVSSPKAPGSSHVQKRSTAKVRTAYVTLGILG